MGLLSKLKEILPKSTKNSSYLIFKEIITAGGEDVLVISIYTLNFKKALNKLLEDQYAQILWNDIKEKYRKKLDEQKLYKVFEFFMIVNSFQENIVKKYAK
jgi:hypothetical protein